MYKIIFNKFIIVKNLKILIIFHRSLNLSTYFLFHILKFGNFHSKNYHKKDDLLLI